MEKWVEGYRDTLANARINLLDSFKSSVEKAKVALKDTMNQLEVLRANHVVDAGAQGFVNFIDGMLAYLSGDKEHREQIIGYKIEWDHQAVRLSHEFEDVTEFPNYRYCFETVVKTPNEDAAPYRATLDSWVIVL